MKSRLEPEAAVGIQCTSPLQARRSYWCIVRTMEAAGFTVRPYHAAIPSFGVWGFALAKLTPFDAPGYAPSGLRFPPSGLRFLDDATMAGMFVMPADLAPAEVGINRLDNQKLVQYYEAEWKRLQ